MNFSNFDVATALEHLSAFIHDHWLKALGALALTVATSWFGLIVAWRRWRTRQDLDVFHYSQNTIEKRGTGPEGSLERWLVLDVHAENPLDTEITPVIPRHLIKKAARKTTVDQPFLLFPPKDRWYVLNLIRLAIAEPFKYGTAAKMSTWAKVDVVHCVFAVTYERYGDMRQGKIRVMIIQQSLLEDPHAFDGPIRVESPSHEARLTTLRKMQADFLRGEKNWEYCQTVRINIQY